VKHDLFFNFNLRLLVDSLRESLVQIYTKAPNCYNDPKWGNFLIYSGNQNNWLLGRCYLKKIENNRLKDTKQVKLFNQHKCNAKCCV